MLRQLPQRRPGVVEPARQAVGDYRSDRRDVIDADGGKNNIGDCPQQ